MESLVKNSLLDGIAFVVEEVGSAWERLRGKTILITGGSGFLGRWFLGSVTAANRILLSEDPCRVVCIDSFIRGRPAWLSSLHEQPSVTVIGADISRLSSERIPPFHFAIHAASIASPIFYRQHPIETMDANVQGLRTLLDVCVARKREVESLLFMSSSEIYGDPPPEAIPTREEYRGNVSCTGPRACYDESKRYGETLCVNFHRVHNTPVKIARPFNNYGPGLSLDDRRVIPDIANNLLSGQDIILHSDGSPTRTYCYAADAVVGYLRLLLSDCNGESFNIGAETPEISVRELAELAVRIAREEFGHEIKIRYRKSDDVQYLTDNPDRRCPNIDKARRLLGYSPQHNLKDGLLKTLRWYHMEQEK